MAKPRARGRAKKKMKPGAPSQRKRRPQLALEELDWKNFPALRRFVSERGKIRSRRITGLSRRQQSMVAAAVKRARQMGLLAYPDQDRKVRATGPGPAGAAPSHAPPSGEAPETAPGLEATAEEAPTREAVEIEVPETPETVAAES